MSVLCAPNPKSRSGMTLEGFQNAEPAVADATGMAHAVIDRLLARHRVKRNVVLRVPGLHVLPMIVANSDLLAVLPRRLAGRFAARVPIRVLQLPVALPQFDYLHSLARALSQRSGNPLDAQGFRRLVFSASPKSGLRAAPRAADAGRGDQLPTPASGSPPSSRRSCRDGDERTRQRFGLYRAPTGRRYPINRHKEICGAMAVMVAASSGAADDERALDRSDCRRRRLRQDHGRRNQLTSCNG